MMRNILKIAALLIGVALSTPAMAQNVICPTAAPGTKDNRCASTAFVNQTIPTAGGALGTILQGQGVGNPAAWSTATYPSSTTINQILYSSSANVIGGIITVNGGILNANSSGTPAMTIAPVLGVPTVSKGMLGLAGNTSGTATIAPQSVAGTPILTLPNSSGTFAVSASVPLALNTATGNITIIGAAGQILAGATPAFTATPILGASGTIGTIGLGNATSGIVTLGTVTGALGTVTASLPANTGTIAEINYAQTWTAIQTFNSDVFFKSGRPWYDVRAYGALGNGVADDTTAINAAIAAAAAVGGGTVYFPQGSYCSFTGLTVNGANGAVYLVGVSDQYGTNLSTCAHDVKLISLTGASHQINNMSLTGYDAPTASATSHVVHFQSGCTNCELNHVLINGGYNGLQNDGVDTIVYDTYIHNVYGDSLLHQTATALWLRRSKLDQVWPVSLPAYPKTFGAWASATGYNIGDVVSSGGYFLQASVAGTSGGSNPTLQPYGTPIVDGIGTLRWQLVGPTTYYALHIDGGSNEIHVEQSDFTGSYASGSIGINAANGGTVPNTIIISDSVMSQAYQAAIRPLAGSGLVLTGNEIGGCIVTNCSTIDLNGTWAGDTTIANNIFGLGIGGLVGINVASGNGTNITGNSIAPFTIGVNIAGNINKFNIIGNNVGTTGWGSNTTGIQVQAGTSTDYTITNNTLTGAGTALTDGGTGLRKTVAGNSGVSTNQFVSSLGLRGTTSGVVGINTQAAAGTYNFNLPTTAGTSGYVLTSGGGGSSPMTWTAPGALIIGTTTITSGTSTRILYDNAGVVGEYTLTGTGTVAAMQTSPTFVTDITTPIAKLSGTSNQLVFQSAGVTGTMSWAPASTNKTITWPDGTTDFTGTSGVLQQASSGAAFTVGAVALTNLATQATNTVVGNATAGSAAPTALAVGSCSSASSALIWTTNTGFGCNTSITAAAIPVGGITGLGTGVATWLATPSSANLASAVTGATGSGALVFGTSPTFTTGITSPLVIGGTTASSVLTLESTSGVGTTDSIVFKTGSQSTRWTIDTNGLLSQSQANSNSNAMGISINNFLAGGYGAKLTLLNSARSFSFYVTGAADGVDAGGVFAVYDNTTGGGGGYRMYINSTGKIGLGPYAYETTRDIGMDSSVARNWGLERHPTANTAGNNFTLNAGGATSGATNKAGGSLYLAPGISTGNGTSSVIIQAYPTSAGSTSDNTIATVATFTNALTTLTGSLTVSALANAATTSAVCYNTGTGVFTYNSTVGTCTVSDERLKNMGPRIDHALDKLLQINGVNYTWKDAAYGTGPQIGVGAQTVEKVFPELVQTGSDGYKSVDYQRLTAPIIEALRELKADNDNLRAEIKKGAKARR